MPERHEMLSSISEDNPGDAMTRVLSADSLSDGEGSRPGEGVDEVADMTASRRQDDASVSVLLRPCLAEFTATLLFVFVGVLSLLNVGRVLRVALGHGLALFILVSITGHRSGGHINPAVSLGVFLCGRMGFVRLLAYWMAQLLGATVGAAMVLGFVGRLDMEFMMYGTQNPATRFGNNGTETAIITDGQAVGLEAVATCILVLTVLTAASDTLGPLCIGMAVAADILAIGDLTGGSMNPARSFGPLLVSVDAIGTFPDASAYFHRYWRRHWIYWVGPFLGAAVASLISRVLLARHPHPRPYLRVKVQ